MFAKPFTITAHLIGSIVVLLTPVSSALSDTRITGEVAFQRIIGRNFKLQCSDGLRGYGRFESRNSVWAAFKLSSDPADALPRRATAKMRVNGKEICFTIDGLDFTGETCAPVTEKSSGNFRFGAKSDWCDVLLIPSLPTTYSVFATP